MAPTATGGIQPFPCWRGKVFWKERIIPIQILRLASKNHGPFRYGKIGSQQYILVMFGLVWFCMLWEVSSVQMYYQEKFEPLVGKKDLSCSHFSNNFFVWYAMWLLYRYKTMQNFRVPSLKTEHTYFSQEDRLYGNHNNIQYVLGEMQRYHPSYAFNQVTLIIFPNFFIYINIIQ